MFCAPTDKALVVSLAVPPESVAVPSKPAALAKVTVPLGAPAPVLAATCAVSATGLLSANWVAEAVSTVVVGVSVACVGCMGCVGAVMWLPLPPQPIIQSDAVKVEKSTIPSFRKFLLRRLGSTSSAIPARLSEAAIVALASASLPGNHGELCALCTAGCLLRVRCNGGRPVRKYRWCLRLAANWKNNVFCRSTQRLLQVLEIAVVL
jgi:hypothetical protein